MKTLIKNGKVVTPQNSFFADLLLEDGKITAVEANLPEEGCQVYDASGCLLFPGFIDAHTHLDMDNGVTVTADNFYRTVRFACWICPTNLRAYAGSSSGRRSDLKLCTHLRRWYILYSGV